jgi:hypothetical protein
MPLEVELRRNRAGTKLRDKLQQRVAQRSKAGGSQTEWQEVVLL